MSLNSELPVSPKPTSPPMLKLLSPGIACPPGMPMVALASPMPAQSTGIVWNLTCVKPTSSSLTVLALSVRVQLKARLRNGESFVADQLALERCAIRLGRVLLVRETPEDPIVARKVRVDLHVTLVGALAFGVGRAPGCSKLPGPVGKRVESLVGEYRAGDWTEPTCRDLIAGKGLPGDRIPDGHGDTREVASPPRFRGDAS